MGLLDLRSRNNDNSLTYTAKDTNSDISTFSSFKSHHLCYPKLSRITKLHLTNQRSLRLSKMPTRYSLY